MKSFLLFFLFFLLNYFQTAFPQKELVFDDYVYDENIKSVFLFPTYISNTTLGQRVPVAELGQNLILKFDEIRGQYQQYHLKVIHCDLNWKPSKINEVEYIKNFNDEIINDYKVSQSTKVNYLHYSAKLPETKISGNYLLVVWRNDDLNDLVLTRRFVVFENKVGVLPKLKFAIDPEFRRTKQQIDFDLNFKNIQVQNPKQDLKVIIKQNFRWNKSIFSPKAFSVNESDKSLSFQSLENEILFDGGNEFRFFDARSSFQKGFYVDKIERGDIDDFFISVQQNRSNFTYLDAIDQNGLYYPQNFDTRDSDTDPDYSYFNFKLKIPELDETKIYVNGAFNDWRLDETNEMEYDIREKAYLSTQFLKQGVYDYNFIVMNSKNEINETELEGNFSDTENIYEFIIYARPPGARFDRVVGYKAVQINKKK